MEEKREKDIGKNTSQRKICRDTQSIKRRESKNTVTENYQFTKDDTKRGRKEQGNYRTARK